MKLNLLNLGVIALPFLLQQLDKSSREKDSTVLNLLGSIDLNNVISTLKEHQRNKPITIDAVALDDDENEIITEVHDIKNIDDRIEKMISVIKQGTEKPSIRTLAASLVRGLPARDDIAEIRAVFNYVRSKVRYTNDISKTEVFQAPDVTLDWQIADCDDFVILLSSLLLNIGHQLQIRVIAEKDNWSHVYLIANIPKPENRRGQEVRRLAIDASVEKPLGWQVTDEKTVTRMRDWEI